MTKTYIQYTFQFPTLSFVIAGNDLLYSELKQIKTRHVNSISIDYHVSTPEPIFEIDYNFAFNENTSIFNGHGFQYTLIAIINGLSDNQERIQDLSIIPYDVFNIMNNYLSGLRSALFRWDWILPEVTSEGENRFMYNGKTHFSYTVNYVRNGITTTPYVPNHSLGFVTGEWSTPFNIKDYKKEFLNTLSSENIHTFLLPDAEINELMLISRYELEINHIKSALLMSLIALERGINNLIDDFNLSQRLEHMKNCLKALDKNRTLVNQNPDANECFALFQKTPSHIACALFIVKKAIGESTYSITNDSNILKIDRLFALRNNIAHEGKTIWKDTKKKVSHTEAKEIFDFIYKFLISIPYIKNQAQSK